MQPSLLVYWEDSKFTDILPGHWFAPGKPLKRQTHAVLLKNGRVGRAVCDVVVEGPTVKLDYQAHRRDNEKWKNWLGVAKLEFPDSSRLDLPSYFWRERGVEKFERVGVKLSFGTASAFDELSGPTTRKQLINARLKQDVFRLRLFERWNHMCAASGIVTPAALRASHIVPWRISSSDQRWDPENGLLLAAHIDALFDRYLISFSDEGVLLVSNALTASDIRKLSLRKIKIDGLSPANRTYLEHHRQEFQNHQAT